MNTTHRISPDEHLHNLRIIDGFRNNSSRVIGECYALVYPMILRFVTQNSGDEEAAKELIWECFEVFFRHCTQSSFELTAKFSSYIHSVAYRIWLKKLRTQQRYQLTEMEQQTSVRHNDSDPTADDYVYAHDDTAAAYQLTETIYENDLQQLVRQLLSGITDECRTIFRLKHEDDLSHDEIAARLQISIDMSKSRLYRCSIKMAQAIKNSPYYRELMEGFPFLERYINKQRKS